MPLPGADDGSTAFSRLGGAVRWRPVRRVERSPEERAAWGQHMQALRRQHQARARLKVEGPPGPAV
jgi:hypothetical protein